MATETKLKLEAPEVLTAVQPQEAAGLVPLKETERSALETKVDSFIDDLVATDANSPEFGKKDRPAHQYGPQGDRRGRGSLQPFPRPPGKGDRRRHRHRRDLTSSAAPSRSSIPAGRAICPTPAQDPGDHSVRQQARQLFPEISVSQNPHFEDPSAASPPARTSS
jgi:hypothetical protein